MSWLNTVLFGWYPYVALTVMVVGSLLRFDHSQYTWRSGSSQLLRRKQLMWGSNLFHIGVLCILGGHFAGLLTPVAVFDVLGVSHGFKQGLAMTFGGIAGIACWIGIALLAHRRLTDPRIRATSSTGDIVILLMLWAQLTLGLLSIPVSAMHMDGHELHHFMTVHVHGGDRNGQQAERELCPQHQQDHDVAGAGRRPDARIGQAAMRQQGNANPAGDPGDATEGHGEPLLEAVADAKRVEYGDRRQQAGKVAAQDAQHPDVKQVGAPHQLFPP